MRIDCFFGDPHLGHKLPRLLKARGFMSVEEHDTALVNYYNATVGDDDIVLWMGDDLFCSLEHAQGILGEMAGRKLTMVGNHDRSASWLAKAGFEVIVGEVLTQIGGRICRVSHFPYFKDEADGLRDPPHSADYPLKHPGEVLLHGHTHSGVAIKNNCINLCPEAWNNYPVTRDQVAHLIGEM